MAHRNNGTNIGKATHVCVSAHMTEKAITNTNVYNVWPTPVQTQSPLTHCANRALMTFQRYCAVSGNISGILLGAEIKSWPLHFGGLTVLLHHTELRACQDQRGDRTPSYKYYK